MLRIIFPLLLITSCALGTKSTGGKHRYRYEPQTEYSVEDLKELASGLVSVEKRDPSVGKLDQLFSKEMPDIKRIGIVVFETEIQPTRSGLSGADFVYPLGPGKQIITEKLLNIWDEGFGLMAPDIDYVSSTKIKDSKALHQYGTEVTDHITSQRKEIVEEDLLWLPSGKKTPMATVLNPRGMRDLSFLLVPASELMGGPKWSEQNKIFLNDIAKELKLDAVLVLMSEVNWTAPRKDKFSNENIPEEMNLKIKATTLIPFGSYHDRLKKLKSSEKPVINVAYRYQEGKMNFPITLEVPEEKRNFQTVEQNILNPMFKAYRDLALMMVEQITHELRKTH